MTPGPRAAWPGLTALLLLLWLLVPGAATAQQRPPRVSAPAAILVEPATGDVVVGKQADARRSIASTTKLMTALLALERLSLDDVLVQVPYRASPVESVAGFRAGERVTVRDELRALLLASANDAAATLAVRISGSRAAFVRDMNARARALGLRDTRYANPVGLDDPDNYSSAADLVKLALVLRTKPFFRETVDLARVTIRSGAFPRTFLNRNSLVRSTPSVDGVKTGRTTRAGYVLVGSASRNGVTVLSAVLGTQSEAARNADTLALLRYGLSRYTRKAAVRSGRRFGEAALAYRDTRVALVAERDVVRTVRRGERLAVRVEGAPTELDGPLPQGARVGTVVVRQRGEVVARVPLVTAAAVTEASAADRLGDFVGRTRTLLLLAVFLLGSLCLVLLRRRSTRRTRRPHQGTTEIA
ncbi:MAG: D-alanyl-D-alanine carboxypeptidase [Solirubrobacterales bacterium]|nr:D-alanyl-D-alanine carboxypeptidase [Solirubrobacterales bacterium]